MSYAFISALSPSPSPSAYPFTAIPPFSSNANTDWFYLSSGVPERLVPAAPYVFLPYCSSRPKRLDLLFCLMT
jgi:hypothetical protein